MESKDVDRFHSASLQGPHRFDSSCELMVRRAIEQLGSGFDVGLRV